MGQAVALRLFFQRRAKVLNANGIRQHQQRDDEGGTKQRPQNRAEGIREELEAVVDPIVLTPHTVVVLLG